MPRSRRERSARDPAARPLHRQNPHRAGGAGAELQQIKRQGYALDDEEFLTGLFCVAVRSSTGTGATASPPWPSSPGGPPVAGKTLPNVCPCSAPPPRRSRRHSPDSSGESHEHAARDAFLSEARRPRAAGRASGAIKVGVIYPCEASALAATFQAADLGFIDPVLIGPSAVIHRLAEERASPSEAGRSWRLRIPWPPARRGVALAGAGEVAALMKGSLHTDELLGAVVAVTVPCGWAAAPATSSGSTARLPQAADADRRGGEHRPGLMGESRHRPQRDRPRPQARQPMPKVAILAAVET